MECAGTHFHVVGLQDHAPFGRPILLEGQDQVLEGGRAGADFSFGHGVLASLWLAL